MSDARWPLCELESLGNLTHVDLLLSSDDAFRVAINYETRHTLRTSSGVCDCKYELAVSYEPNDADLRTSWRGQSWC